MATDTNLSDAQKLNFVAFCDYGRDPEKVFGEFYKDWTCLTWTCNNDLWLFAVNPSVAPKEGRKVNDDERCKLQGFQPAYLAALKGRVSKKKAIGNSIPPPMAGCVLAPFVEMMANFQGSSQYWKEGGPCEAKEWLSSTNWPPVQAHIRDFLCVKRWRRMFMARGMG